MGAMTPTPSAGAPSPFPSIANWRDLGYWIGFDEKIVRPGVVYRTNDFAEISDADRAGLAALELKTIVDRFYSRTGKLHGKKSILMATAYNSADWTMSALVDHYDTLVRYMEWQDVGKVLGIGCGARSLVEHSKFGDMAETMGANL